MVARIQILRSTTAGTRPAGKQYGELYYNQGDNQLGIFDSGNVARDLLGTHGSLAGGRLNNSSANPVNAGSISGASTIYYVPYFHQFVPLYNGSFFVMVDIGGVLSQTLNDTTKSPAAAVANKNYDMFVWDDAGTRRCTRGPVWTSDTVRGTGTGTTELVRGNGILVNANAITNGPAAFRGTYVGSVRANGSVLVDWIFGAAGSGGVAGNFGIWNLYNRIDIRTQVTDTFSSASVTATNQQFNGSANNRVSYLAGLPEDVFEAEMCAMAIAGSGGTVAIGVGYDNSVLAGTWGLSGNSAMNVFLSGRFAQSLGGWHYFQGVQSAITANATVYGGSGLANMCSTGLTFRGRL